MPDRREKTHEPPASNGPEAGPAPTPGTNRLAWLLALVPAVLAPVAFLPARDNVFLDWDDLANIVGNNAFRGMGWEQLRWDWTTLHMGVYQPIAWMILGGQYLACGLDPRGYHLTSLSLHAAVAVALYALVVALLARCQHGPDEGRPWAPQFAAALAVSLYMVHPLRTEAVAWVSCQPYLPCALFSTLTVLAYLHAHPPGRPARPWWVAVAFVLFALAALSKAAALGLPAVLLVLDVYPLRRLGPGNWSVRTVSRVVAEKVPFAALSALLVGVALRAKELAAYPNRLQPGGVVERVCLACYGACFYPIKTLWPSGLNAYYALPDRIVWSEPRFMLSVAAVLGVTLTLILLRRRRPALLAAWACYLLLLAPSSGLSRVGAALAADRYSYIAMMGAAALLAAPIASSLRAGRRKILAAAVLGAAGLGLISGLSALSWRQCRTWRDTVTLWRHAVAQTPSPAPEMLVYLGTALVKSEGPAVALPYVTRAVEIAPDYPEARLNLGSVLFNLGRFDEAAEQYAAAIRLREDYAEAYLMLGRIRFARGQLDEAERLLDRAVTFRPDMVTLQIALGGVYMARGRLDEAAERLRLAVRLGPDNPDAHYSYGVCLRQQRRTVEAAAEFAETLRIRPDYVDALSDLGTLIGEQGRLDEASRYFNEALRIRPDHANANYNAGILLARAGRLYEAEAHLARAVESQPNHAQAQQALATVRQLAGRQGQP